MTQSDDGLTRSATGMAYMSSSIVIRENLALSQESSDKGARYKAPAALNLSSYSESFASSAARPLNTSLQPDEIIAQQQRFEAYLDQVDQNQKHALSPRKTKARAYLRSQYSIRGFVPEVGFAAKERE